MIVEGFRMPQWLLEVNVVDGPVPAMIWALTALVALAVLLRRRRGWAVRAVVALTLGALVGAAAVVLVTRSGALDAPLPPPSAPWLAAGLALVGLGLVGFWKASAWRRVLAFILIVLALLSTALGINGAFGIDRTLGAVLGVSSTEALDSLTGPHQSGPQTGPVYAKWTPPSDMPTAGKVGLLTGPTGIPSSAGFVPRDASIYLPPAAQVANAPALPLVVMMMGQPGNPDPQFITEALDAMASQHQGLAPIVIVADQLGDPNSNPICTDSTTFGGVSTYVNKDIVDYAKAHLNILTDPQYWTIAGYSNGGGCAFKWAAEYPKIWGNVASISGEEFGGSEDPATAVQQAFNGDQAAFEAAKPAAILARNPGAYAGHVAVFTAGENDPDYVNAAQSASAEAQAAGFDTTTYVVPGADHVVTALRGGLPKAFEILYPRLGLSKP